MASDQTQEQKDFFISYTGRDSQWAQWIAFELEAAGYTTRIQAWDFRPGFNFVVKMDEAARQTERTILVLSETYLTSGFAFSEWAAAFREDPRGTQGKVLPVRIQPCRIESLLGPIGYIDLVDLDEQKAREKLLVGVKRERAKPASVAFPTASDPSGPLEERPVFPASLPPVWNVPYPPNPLFTGREELLLQLATTLHKDQPTALSQPQAISGLGGIGKTQLALEYAYRYRTDYQAVLWAQADTCENLTSSYLTIATLLNLPEQGEQESSQVIAAVKNWLQYTIGWLLILDNADDLTLARDFLPPSPGGHVLLTTRAQTTSPFAHRLQVDVLPTELGALFLLRRAGRLSSNTSLEQASDHDRDQACAICEELGGLPLALDQAGAYIEETRCGLSDYLPQYQVRQAVLLQRRGGVAPDHPASIATTWSLAFESVERANPAAADVLRLCAFLSPDAIPEEMVVAGMSRLALSEKHHKKPEKKGWLPAFLKRTRESISQQEKVFVLDDAITVILAYSLLYRDPQTHTLSVHRLVQAVQRESMTAEEKKQWKQRAVQAVNTSYPDVQGVSQWNACERWLPHALVCAAWIEQEAMGMADAAGLLNQTGCYLDERARYTEAEPLLVRALAIREQQLGAQHPHTAQSLNNLAMLYSDQGKYSQAEPLLKRALYIREQQLGALHPDTAQSLNNLALLYYRAQGKTEQAEPLLRRAVSIMEQQVGPNHPDTATALNNLATLYRDQLKYEQAEPLLVRALAICEQQVGPNHPGTATSLDNLAGLYRVQSKDAQAEPLYQRALSIMEQQLGPQHPHTATSLDSLAMLYSDQGKYSQAEPLLVRALAIREQQLGAQHPHTAQSLNNLAMLYSDQGKYSQAEPLLVRALAIREQQLGAQHPHTASSLNSLALLYHRQGKYSQAEPLLVRALAICEQQLGAEHPHTATSLNNLAGLYFNQGKYSQAEPLWKRALQIREQQLGPQHPNTAMSLNNLAGLYRAQGKYVQAEPLWKRALAIYEQQLGPQHPDTQNIRTNYTSLLRAMGRENETRE